MDENIATLGPAMPASVYVELNLDIG